MSWHFPSAASVDGYIFCISIASSVSDVEVWLLLTRKKLLCKGQLFSLYPESVLFKDERYYMRHF